MDDDIESDGDDVDSFDDVFEDDVGELDAVADAEDIAVSEDTDTFAEDIMQTDPSEDSFETAVGEIVKDVAMYPHGCFGDLRKLLNAI